MLVTTTSWISMDSNILNFQLISLLYHRIIYHTQKVLSILYPCIFMYPVILKQSIQYSQLILLAQTNKLCSFLISNTFVSHFQYLSTQSYIMLYSISFLAFSSPYSTLSLKVLIFKTSYELLEKLLFDYVALSLITYISLTVTLFPCMHKFINCFPGFNIYLQLLEIKMETLC